MKETILGFKSSFIKAYKEYFTISGYSSRKEFWSFFLVNLLVIVLFLLLAKIHMIFALLLGLYILATYIPIMSLTVRRFNDAGKGIYTLLAISIIPSVLQALTNNLTVNNFITFLLGLYYFYILLRDTREHPAEKTATIGEKIVYVILLLPLVALVLAITGAISTKMML